MLEFLIQIDRALLLFLNGCHSLFADGMAVTLTNGMTWIPLYVALICVVVKNNESAKQTMLTILAAVLCVLVTATFSELITKPLVGRLRPAHDPSLAAVIDITRGIRGAGYSFFSSHAANTFGLAVFMSLLIRDRVFTVFMVGWSLVNCWTRLYLGVHYPSDILTGILFGGVVGFAVYVLYLKAYYLMSPKFNYISSHYTKTGYALSDLDIIYSVLTITLLFAVFYSMLTAFQVF